MQEFGRRSDNVDGGSRLVTSSEHIKRRPFYRHGGPPRCQFPSIRSPIVAVVRLYSTQLDTALGEAPKARITSQYGEGIGFISPAKMHCAIILIGMVLMCVKHTYPI